MASIPAADRPERLGRYLLCRSVGSGGMGEVHRARAYGPAGVLKELCIKRIRRERLARPGEVERFVAEARTSMQLTHGNIVQVFDFGRAGDEYFLAMEWVDGADLRAILAKSRELGSPLPPEVIAFVAACVARGLAHAHEPGPSRRSIVHCDVKPENVLVSRAGEVKIADFGASAVVGEGTTAGTAPYMAPEQSSGGAVTPAVDLYSLGVMLREMWTGARPGREEEPIGKVPDELASLLAALVATDPRQRPESALGVAERLEEYVSRARAKGGVAPQGELARVAAVARAETDDIAAPEPLGADASFLRDGETATFSARMTGTTARLREPKRCACIAGLPREEAQAPDGGCGDRFPGDSRSGVSLLPTDRKPRASIEPSGANRVVTRTEDAPAVRDSQEDAPAAEPTPPGEQSVEERVLRPAGPRATVHRRPALRQERSPRNFPEVPPSPAAPPPEPARLSVNAIPWAEVVIDGRAVGETPIFELRLPAGAHSIELRN